MKTANIIASGIDNIPTLLNYTLRSIQVRYYFLKHE